MTIEMDWITIILMVVGFIVTYNDIPQDVPAVLERRRESGK